MSKENLTRAERAVVKTLCRVRDSADVAYLMYGTATYEALVDAYLELQGVDPESVDGDLSLLTTEQVHTLCLAKGGE